MMDVDSGELEWEYEYHENETEDFYIVLDIPTGKKVANAANVDIFAPMVPPKPKKPRPKGTGRGRGTRPRRASNARGGASSRPEVDGEDSPLAQDDSDEDDQAPQNVTSQNTAPEPVHEPSQQATNGKGEPAPSDFQLMDLNTDNPIISYGGSLYSCQWASSIGSDLLFKKKPIEIDPKQHVLHSFDEWDLIAISAAKLIASPATFQRRQPTSANVTQVDKSNYESETKALQADFIKRLANMKKQMGQPIGSMLTSIQPVVPPGAVTAAVPALPPTRPSEPIARGRGRGGGRGKGRGRGGSRGRGRGRGRGSASPAATFEPRLTPLAPAPSMQPHLAPLAPAPLTQTPHTTSSFPQAPIPPISLAPSFTSTTSHKSLANVTPAQIAPPDSMMSGAEQPRELAPPTPSLTAPVPVNDTSENA